MSIFAGAQMVAGWEPGDITIGPVMPHTYADTVEKARELTTKLYEKLYLGYGIEVDFMLVEREDKETEWKEYRGQA